MFLSGDGFLSAEDLAKAIEENSDAIQQEVQNILKKFVISDIFLSCGKILLYLRFLKVHGPAIPKLNYICQ